MSYYQEWKKEELDSPKGFRNRLRAAGWDAQWTRTIRGGYQWFRIWHKALDYYLGLTAGSPKWEGVVSAIEAGELPEGVRGDGAERRRPQ